MSVVSTHADRDAKSQTSRGEHRPRAKLTDNAVRAIRERYAASGVLQAQLTAGYGVRGDTISMIITRRTWKHVKD